MSTDHHLDDNADDQVRDSRRNVHELEELQQILRSSYPTPPEVRARHTSALTEPGVRAGRDVAAGEGLVDLVGPPETVAEHTDAPALSTRHQVIRAAGALIPAGSAMEIRADGRVYPVDQDALDLAEQLVDVAETAAAGELVDQTITRVAEELSPAPDLDFAEAIAGMANRHLQEAGLALEVVEACAGCGCTNRHACILDNPRSIGGGMHVQTCHWIQTPAGDPPRCSKCGPTPEAYDSAPASLMGIRVHLDETIPEGQVQLRDRHTGETLMTIHNIEEPTAEEAQRAQVLLVHGEEHPLPYAASATVTVARHEEPEPGIFGSQDIADALGGRGPETPR